MNYRIRATLADGFTSSVICSTKHYAEQCAQVVRDAMDGGNIKATVEIVETDEPAFMLWEPSMSEHLKSVAR